MKHLYYPFSSFTLEIGYCFKKEILVPQNWQAERVDSSLWFDAQTHVDFNSLRVKAKAWVQAWHFGDVTVPLRPCLLIVTWVPGVFDTQGLWAVHNPQELCDCLRGRTMVGEAAKSQTDCLRSRMPQSRSGFPTAGSCCKWIPNGRICRTDFYSSIYGMGWPSSLVPFSVKPWKLPSGIPGTTDEASFSGDSWESGGTARPSLLAPGSRTTMLNYSRVLWKLGSC